VKPDGRPEIKEAYRKNRKGEKEQTIYVAVAGEKKEKEKEKGRKPWEESDSEDDYDPAYLHERRDA